MLGTVADGFQRAIPHLGSIAHPLFRTLNDNLCHPVCTENLIRIDCVTESPNVNGDDRALLPLPDPVRLAVQVEEPT